MSPESYVPEAKWFFMVDIYGKDEQDDLSPAQKKSLRSLAEEMRRQARQAAGRQKGKRE